MTATRTLLLGAACGLLLALALLEPAAKAAPRRPFRRPAHHQHHLRHSGWTPYPVPAVPRPPRHALPEPLSPFSPSLLDELRRKRNPQTSVSVKQAEEIGMCKFVVAQDVDPNRMPEIIWTVTCREAGCQCGSEGDFRCTQLTSEVNVTYKNGAKNQVLYPNSGCICAAKEAADAMSAAPKVTT